MIREFSYDTQKDPAAPALPLRLGIPGAEPGYSLIALVDTGADMTVIPRDAADRLKLQTVGEIIVRGVDGVRQRVPVYPVVIEAAGFREPVEVIALGREGLVGRDLLNRWVVTLRGPRRVLEIDVSASGG